MGTFYEILMRKEPCNRDLSKYSVPQIVQLSNRLFARLFHFGGRREINGSWMAAFLNVVPDEPVCQPCRLFFRQLGILECGLVSDDVAIPTLAALHHLHGNCTCRRRIGFAAYAFCTTAIR